MYVIEVVPLSVGGSVDTLSYFSSIPYERGSVITIPIRARDTDAVVMSALPVSALKTVLRAATFTLRKLPPQIIVGHLSPTFLTLVDTIALERAQHQTDVLSSLVPKRRELLQYTSHTHRTNALPVVQLLINTEVGRFDEYQRIVRESFAKHESVVCVVPTLRSVEYAVRALSSGIEKYVVVLRGGKATKAEREQLARLGEAHPLLIITTPTYAYLERSDIGTTIIESSRSKGYKTIKKPYLDHVHALLTHARLAHRNVIIGDLVPHAEHMVALRERRFEAYGELPKRVELPGELMIVHQKKDHDGTVPFTLFSETMLTGIEDVLKKRGRVFLLSARRGLSPLVACADCGFMFRDPESGAPLSLHRAIKNGVEERWLVSQTSGARQPMRDVCPSCGSWRLRERGIGIQHVESELRKALPHVAITVFDHTTATTEGKARKIADIFYAIHSQVMLGTPLALPYLEKPIDASGVVSMDSLLAVPSWRQNEEVFATLLALREKTDGPVWAQTRHRPDDSVLALAEKGSLADFYDEEIEARKTYSYPPYGSFVLLSYQGTKSAVDAIEVELKERFGAYGILCYGMPPGDDGRVLRRGLLRFPRESWPDDAIVDAIRALPPTIKVEFDPERIV